MLSPSNFKKRFPGDTWEENGNNLYGCLKQVWLLPHLGFSEEMFNYWPRCISLNWRIGEDIFSRHSNLSERSGSRTLKVLLSIGGWTYSQDGHFAFVANPTLRATFIASAVQLIRDYGFDGMCVAPFCSRIYNVLTLASS